MFGAVAGSIRARHTQLPVPADGTLHAATFTAGTAWMTGREQGAGKSRWCDLVIGVLLLDMPPQIHRITETLGASLVRATVGLGMSTLMSS